MRIRAATCPIHDRGQLSITIFRTPEPQMLHPETQNSNSAVVIVVAIVMQSDTVELEERVGNFTTRSCQSTV